MDDDLDGLDDGADTTAGYGDPSGEAHDGTNFDLSDGDGDTNLD